MKTDININSKEKKTQEVMLDKVDSIKEEMHKVVIGQEDLINKMLIALFCDGHILLEGVPGLAKTTAIATLASVLDLDFKRLQFTPDLLPSDLIGSQIYHHETGEFSVKKGPVFTNFVLADEINRAPAKVQSALLEAMQERQVTIGNNTLPLPKPFFVMATQNPIEQEGTYPLPEAQTDRFLFKTIVNYPSAEEELKIMDSSIVNGEKPQIQKQVNAEDIQEMREEVKNVYVDESIKKYITDIVRATRHPETYLSEDVKSLFGFGASPRASIGLLYASKAVAFMAGRDYVTPEDVKYISYDVLRHRVIPTYEAEAEGVTQDELVKIVLEHVPVP